MRVVFVFLSGLLFSTSALAEIASTDYIRKQVKKNWDIDHEETSGSIASSKYLYNIIDKTNLLLNDLESNYKNAATSLVIDKNKADIELAAKTKYCAPGTYLRSYSEACV
ncbi:MAG: hypothetical protein LBF37_02960, partial [Rickettsiales bacterium]|nr:hypothetical protein [Rickettsiales bacterium]